MSRPLRKKTLVSHYLLFVAESPCPVAPSLFYIISQSIFLLLLQQLILTSTTLFVVKMVRGRYYARLMSKYYKNRGRRSSATSSRLAQLSGSSSSFRGYKKMSRYGKSSGGMRRSFKGRSTGMRSGMRRGRSYMKRYHRDHISRSINITAVSQGSLVNLYTASVATTCSGFYMTGVSHKGVQEVGATGFAGTPYVGLILVVPEGIPDSEVTNNTGVIPPTLSLGNVPLTGNPANIPIQEIENDLGNRITESARRRRLPGGLADPELNLDEAADEVLNQTQELYKPSKQIITHFAGVAFWGPGTSFLFSTLHPTPFSWCHIPCCTFHTPLFYSILHHHYSTLFHSILHTLFFPFSFLSLLFPFSFLTFFFFLVCRLYCSSISHCDKKKAL